MSEEDILYRREILRLAADASGAGHLAAPDTTATAHNPACGDRVTVELALADGRVTALAHATQACVLTQASAALLSGQAPGRSQAELEALAAAVRRFLAGIRVTRARGRRFWAGTACRVSLSVKLVELRGIEPLTPRLPASCSPS